MPNNALDWKEKYLTLLDQQETLEAHFARQTDLLKRALVRSSVAAEGHDEQLDQALQQLALPKTLQKNLKLFVKELPKQLTERHGLYAALEQFKALQEQALETAQPQAVALTKAATPGFFGRLFKANESTVLNNETAEPNHATAQQQAHNAEPATPTTADADADADAATDLATHIQDQAIEPVKRANLIRS